MITVKTIEGKGRGVFATEIIPPETIIEIAPVTILPSEQKILLDQTDFF